MAVVVVVGDGGGVLVDPEDEDDEEDDDEELDVGEVVVVVPLAPFTMVNASDSGSEPVSPLRGSRTTW
jgi:hypothetical protein